MIKKYLVLICVVISVVLLVIATSLYPGGSILDSNSTGFDWSKNFISNLFEAKAINGLDNPSRMWALLGMAFHSVGYGTFFINTSKKIPHWHSAHVLKYTGVLNMLFTFLIATPLHDIMVTISSTLTLIGLFYSTYLSLSQDSTYSNSAVFFACWFSTIPFSCTVRAIGACWQSCRRYPLSVQQD